MNHGVKKPCRECPFRKEALAGWLGSSTPEQFLATTMADHAMPCHLTVDYGDRNWKAQLESGKASHCAGALDFFANICKMSRDRNRPRGQRNDAVFASPQAFLAHHESHGKRGSADWGDE